MRVSRTVDAVVIGSGHNGLVAAAYLARAGWRVEVLERNELAGGAVATEELTRPGYRHDTFSSWHPLFHLSAAWAELGPELRERGLEYVNAEDVVTATALPDGSAVVAHRDAERTVAELAPADGRAYLEDLEALGASMDVVGELLGTELQSAHAARLAARLGRRLGVREARGFGALLARSARGWLETRFEGRQLGDLLAPWVLHTGLTPDDAGGAFQLTALAGALHEVGLPVVRGGSDGFVRAFVQLIEDTGGSVRTGTEVERIVMRDARAVGVETADGQVVAARAVIASATPTQLYGRLLPPGAAPERAVAEAHGFKYADRAGMQIHLALSEPPRWRGDAAGEIDVGDGTWTSELENAYADRIVARLASQIENLPAAIAGRAILSPAELERRNLSFVRGDIYAGATTLDQSYLWRPLPSFGSHRTPVPGLYQIGASTYPGPGLNAASGRIAALELLRPSPLEQVRARLSRRQRPPARS